ncbi:hypothetical protein P167DRAFT_547594 [Morchella conica CCBAS932]|uniref:C2H2-type domain-containing protein n=1 Tax=Morchella conica CCBAS932 TaxID=1392247 RepID=A0A3N4KNX4_9PEZI|nr:hypothetical protein P167DRAFT_547594 [Morchella conica CCBAS932]
MAIGPKAIETKTCGRRVIKTPCLMCGKEISSSLKTQKNHLKRKHFPSLQCQGCGLGFGKAYELTRHSTYSCKRNLQQQLKITMDYPNSSIVSEIDQSKSMEQIKGVLRNAQIKLHGYKQKRGNEVMDDVSSEDGEHELEDIEMYNGTPGDSVGSTPLESGLLPHCLQLGAFTRFVELEENYWSDWACGELESPLPFEQIVTHPYHIRS